MSELAKCKVAQYCGGCQLQHLSYQQQLQLKQKKMDELFKKIHAVNPIIGMEDPYRYRNKVQVAFGYDRGRVLCGNYVVSTHKIVDVKDCMLADERAQKIINTIKKMAVSFKLSIFNEDTYKGFLRHVLVRTAKEQIMVVIVTGTPIFPKKKDFINVLLEKHPEITTIVQCVNNKHTSMVLSDNCTTLYGKGYIEDQLCGKTFRLSANSFYQVNRYQTEVLYNTAIKMANISKNDVVIDAYCGIGTIGMAVADYAKEVIGVEINKQAIADAKINAKINNIENI